MEDTLKEKLHKILDANSYQGKFSEMIYWQRPETEDRVLDAIEQAYNLALSERWVDVKKQTIDGFEPISEMDKARFWSKVNQTEYCWEWSAYLDKNGYGVFSLGKYSPRVSAHRFAYMLINGSIETGKVVCHSCDNPKCVNPSHLFIGTHQDNMRDMHVKGRARIQGKTSKYLGVGWRKDIMKWFAHVRIDGKTKKIGIFKTENEAKDFRDKYIESNKLILLFENGNSFTLPTPPQTKD